MFIIEKVFFQVQLVADVRCPRVVSMYIIAWSVLPCLDIQLVYDSTSVYTS